MLNVAFIPVRGGSKSIPLKNIKELCGKPLVYWTVKAACQCGYIDRVYVATDSERIRETVEGFCSSEKEAYMRKVSVIGRSAESASDMATTESAMLEFAREYDFDNIALIQATSPLLEADSLNKGFELFNTENTDSVLSVVRQKRFCWNTKENGEVYPLNYDVYNRPRRQEFSGYLVENGAFYITSKEALLRSNNRISGRIKALVMDEDTFLEIDEPSDWAIIETLMKKRQDSRPTERTDEPDIRMLLTDCDGCLTDGGMYYSEKGDELKKFNTRDGAGFTMLKEKGILTGIITGENVRLNERRAKKMGADIFVGNCTDKLSAVQEICRQYGIAPENVAYIGDDRNDLEVIKAVGFSCCPQDAPEEVKKYADSVTSASGGQGVVREVAERLVTPEYTEPSRKKHI